MTYKIVSKPQNPSLLHLKLDKHILEMVEVFTFYLYDLQLAGVEGQMDGKFCSSGEGGTDDKDLSLCACMCGSAHDCA